MACSRTWGTTDDGELHLPAVRVMARLTSPCTARAAPDAVGAASTTSGIALTSAMIFCHWSIERTRWRGCWMMAASTEPFSTPSARVVSGSGMSTMWAWVLSTRCTKLACMPVSRADMKTITATPMATPIMMKAVCMRPSRMKRTQTIHS